MRRVALVAAESGDHSLAARRLRALLPALESALELELFTDEAKNASQPWSIPVRPLAELAPRDFQQILYFLEDSEAHAFMVPMLRDLGGAVVLHDWNMGRLARALRPALARPGLAGRIAAWREGGLSAFKAFGRSGPLAALENLPLNRSVVRYADAFIVPDEAWRRPILEERNAPTPVAVVSWDSTASAEAVASSAAEFIECLQLLPTHRTNRKSLIRTAIDQADQAREERD